MGRTARIAAGNLLAAISLKGLSAVAVWGASFVATRVALRALSPSGLVALRLLAGTLLLGGVMRLRGGRVFPLRRDLPACAMLGAVLSVHLLIQAYGLRYTSAIHTGWIIGFIPVTIALGARLLGQQRLSPIGWTGVAFGTGGVLLVTISAPPDFARARCGDLLQIASCLTWTVYTLASVGPVRRNGALRVTAFGMAVATLICGLGCLGGGVASGPLTAEALVSLAFLGLVCSGIAYYLWFAAQREHGPARVGALLYVEPFVTLATAVALIGEPVTVRALVGGLGVLAGVWLVARGSRRPALPAGGD